MNGKIVALAAVGMMLAGQAMAADAQISSVTGAVLASQNGKFSTATAASTLKVGDRIVARDGTAQVTYSDGCAVSVKANTMLTVAAASPCATGAGLVSASDATSAQFMGMPGTAGAALLTFVGLGAVLLVVGDSQNDDTISP